MRDYNLLEKHLKFVIRLHLEANRFPYNFLVEKDEYFDNLKNFFIALKELNIVCGGVQRQYTIGYAGKIRDVYNKFIGKWSEPGQEKYEAAKKGILKAYLEEKFLDKKNLLLLIEANYADMIKDPCPAFMELPSEIYDSKLDEPFDNNFFLLFLEKEIDRKTINNIIHYGDSGFAGIHVNTIKVPFFYKDKER